MAKSLILAATIALSLGAGTAMAQEADAQFLPPSAFQRVAPLSQGNATVHRTYSVQSHQLPVYAEPGMVGGSDGSGA
jgi:hypothetical protein